MTSSLFFLSTLNYDARSTTHQIYEIWFTWTTVQREIIRPFPWQQSVLYCCQLYLGQQQKKEHIVAFPQQQRLFERAKNIILGVYRLPWSVTELSVLLLMFFEFILVKIKLVMCGFGILTSNLLHLSSQILTITIFVTVDLQKTIYTQYVMSIKYQI